MADRPKQDFLHGEMRKLNAKTYVQNDKLGRLHNGIVVMAWHLVVSTSVVRSTSRAVTALSDITSCCIQSIHSDSVIIGEQALHT